MDIKFHTVSGDDSDFIESKPAPLGIIMLEDVNGSSWEMRRSDNFSESGSGQAIKISPGTSWINNLSYDDSRGFFNQKDQQQLVRSGAWIGFEIHEILSEWAYGDIDLAQKASFMSKICGRISDTAYGLCLHLDKRNAAKKTREIYRTSSLAASIKALNEFRIADSVPSDKEIIDRFMNAYQNGIQNVGHEKSSDEILLEFIYPRVSYALSVADCDVPSSGSWKRAAMPENADRDEFISYILKNFGKSVLFRAVHDFDMQRDPAWLRAVLGHKGGLERSRFTGDEIEAFKNVPALVSSVLVPDAGFSRSATARMLDDFVHSFGGLESASMSWTAGLFAENILMSSARAGRSRDQTESGDAVWIFARDRVQTSPLTSALHESGANVIKARNGRVLVSLPKSSENVLTAAYAAWELGAHLTYGSAQVVKTQVGCDLPQDRDSWAGSDIDHMIAAITHSGGRRDLWNLDGMCRLEAKEKKVQATNVMAAWNKRLKGEK